MIKSCRFLVVLDTMWGAGGEKAPAWFAINPLNHSGKRLYKITRSAFGGVWVTNSCKFQVGHSNAHGKPDPICLAANLRRLPVWCKKLPLLVMGKVAQQTYCEISWDHEGPVLMFPHPAARNWTKASLQAATELIGGLR